MEQFSEYEVKQLTGQGECYIHTHPKDTLTQNSSLQLQLNQPILPVVDGATLTYKQDFVSISPAGASVHLYLPSAVKPKWYTIFMIGSGTVTIHADGTDTISGNAAKILSRAWSVLWIKCDGAGTWFDLESVVGIGSAGTAALPALFFNNDTNTGIYSPGADQIGISTGGTSRMTIDSSGNVGIGTTTPALSGNAGRTYLTLIGTSGASPIGVLQLANSTAASSNNGNIEWLDIGNTASSSTRNAFISSGSEGSAANNRGSYLDLATKSDGVSGAGTTRIRIDSSGVVSIASGQIKFPATQNASSDANTLDDYEEGTFTPGLGFFNAPPTTLTLSTALGRYTKIGRQVTCDIRIVVSAYTAGSASGPLVVNGLPFTVANPGAYPRSSGVATGTSFSTLYPTIAQAEPGVAALLLYNGSAAQTDIGPTNLTSTSSMQITITYQAAS